MWNNQSSNVPSLSPQRSEIFLYSLKDVHKDVPFPPMETELMSLIVWFEPNKSCHTVNRSWDWLTYLLPVLRGSSLVLIIEFMKWWEKRFPLELNVRKLCLQGKGNYVSLSPSIGFFSLCGIASVFLDTKVILWGNSTEYLIYSYSSRNILKKDLYNIFIHLFFTMELSGFVIFQLLVRKSFLN